MSESAPAVRGVAQLSIMSISRMLLSSLRDSVVKYMQEAPAVPFQCRVSQGAELYATYAHNGQLGHPLDSWDTLAYIWL